MDEKDDFKFTIRACKRLEDLLTRKLGAFGRGLHTKVDSVESKLPAVLVKKLRYIATIRNVLVHEEGRDCLEDRPGFEQACLDAERQLNALQKPAAPVAPTSKLPQQTKQQPSPVPVFPKSDRQSAPVRSRRTESSTTETRPIKLDVGRLRKQVRTTTTRVRTGRLVIFGLCAAALALLVVHSGWKPTMNWPTENNAAAVDAGENWHIAINPAGN